jgi:hypothetical protein
VRADHPKAGRTGGWVALGRTRPWRRNGDRGIFGTLSDSSIVAYGRGLALASLLLATAAFQACAEGEALDDTQIPARKDGGSRAGTAGAQAGASNSTSGTAGDTSGSGGGAGTATNAGGSNAGNAGVGGGEGGGAGASGGGTSGSGGAAGNGGASGSAGAGGAGGNKDAGAAGMGGTGGTAVVSDAGPTCDYSKAPVYALIANQNGSNPTDNVIQFDLKLVNTTSNGVALSSFKVRYYFTDENAGPSAATNYFSKMDGASYIPVDPAKIYITRYDLAPAKTGANAYLEITFDAVLGSLPANDYVWVRAQFHHNDYRVFNESDDFSYLPSNAPADEGAWEACKTEPVCPSFANCKTVVLQGTTVVFGTPP